MTSARAMKHNHTITVPDTPVLSPIPYGRQWVDEEDIRTVMDVLQSDWLTTGPKVAQFEDRVADVVGAASGVAVSSGTAALHSALFAAGIGPGDDVIVPPMTFAATANAVVFLGARPVFVDVDPGSLLIDPEAIEAGISERTRAILTVDYAGQPCDFDALQAIARRHKLVLIDDACHALGAAYKNRNVGTLADMTVFSFHPVKHVTTGEGGMIVTDNGDYEDRLRLFRNHGISSDHHQRSREGSWHYEMIDLGFNYRIPDILCALGISQMERLPYFLERRRKIAEVYDDAITAIPGVTPLSRRPDRSHAYHLYVVRIDEGKTGMKRSDVFEKLKERNIHANVHYIPVHLHPYYRKTLGTGPGDCPAAEKAYDEILSLPMYPGLSDDDLERVIETLERIFK